MEWCTMIEVEHYEICQADKEEQIFLNKCRKLLEEAGFHPLNRDELPRAAPRAKRTHHLEYDPRTKEYTPVPTIPQHERAP